MELTVRLVTMPWPGTRTKILILVIIIVAMLLARGAGEEPVIVISLISGSGLAAAPGCLRTARRQCARAAA